MLNIAIDVLQELEWCSDYRCKICGGVGPNAFRQIHEKEGHRPGCRLKFCLDEFDGMKDIL